MTKNEINHSWIAVENWLSVELEKANNSERPYGYGNLSRNLKTPGVYAIYFAKTKQVFLGGTTHLYKERLSHLLNLKNGIHSNPNLQQAFDDSGLHAFMFFYKITATKEEAVTVEQKLIDDYWGNPLLLNRIKDYKHFDRIIKNRTANLSRLLEISNKRFEDSCLNPSVENISTTTNSILKVNLSNMKNATETIVNTGLHIPNEVSEKKLPVITNNTSQGIVMYPDGSARPTNPGKNAWGVHGYLYSNEEPKKGSGNQTHILTASGYVPKSVKGKDGFTEVKPLHYFDMFGSSLEINSNNVAELDGTRSALLKAAEYDINTLIIYTDSEYVRRGVEEWSPGWVKRGWIRNDGNPVPNSNHWKALLAALNVLKEKGVSVTIKWVKGHTDTLGSELILGNILADKLATIGVMYSMKNILRTECKISVPEGYWKQDIEKHPFISNKRMYFNTLTNSQITGEYYLGDHGTDDELLGKKTSNGGFSIVQLEAPDHALEVLRNYQTAIAYDIDSIIMVRLDKLYSPETYNEIIEYEEAALVRANAYSLDINCLDTKPLTKELRPPRLAMRAVEALTCLKEILNRFKLETTAIDTIPDSGINFRMHDVTDLFYEKETKVKKKVEETILKLKPSFNVGFTSLPIRVDIKKNSEPLSVDLTLTLGLDLPDRNSLKRMEEMNPTINVITWLDGPASLRYATIIKAQDSYGIWAGVYSNLIFI